MSVFPELTLKKFEKHRKTFEKHRPVSEKTPKIIAFHDWIFFEKAKSAFSVTTTTSVKTVSTHFFKKRDK